MRWFGVLSVLLVGCFSPEYQSELSCSDRYTCPPGQGCNETLATCTPECADGHCALEFEARIVNYATTAHTPEKNALLRIFGRTSDPMQPLSGEDGIVHFEHLPPQTLLELTAAIDQRDPLIGTSILTTHSLFGNLAEQTSQDVPVVEYPWLAQALFDCVGPPRFLTLEDAKYGPNASANPYFISRAAIIGEAYELDGSPAHLTRSKIKVLLNGHANSHLDPADTDEDKTFVCFLEEQGGMWVARNTDESPSGHFLMFRVSNGVTGTGFAQVQIQGFPNGYVILRSSGDIGVVTMRKGVPPAELPAMSFAANVYPRMQQLGCPTCHRVGGVGYEMSETRGGKQADFSLPADQVREVLLAGMNENSCDVDPARVCLRYPEKSLLFTKPRLETDGTSDHLGISFDETDVNLKLFLDWIKNGAPK